MVPFSLTLLQKIQLTYNVYELIYSMETPLDILPGQFLLCETEKDTSHLLRAYSVSDVRDTHIHFIIKRLEDGKGGSKAICDQEIGHIMQAWWPSGAFVLPTENIPTHIVFIGTGTGFAPLYFQAKKILEENPRQKISFIFWVRAKKDLFYNAILQEWTQKYPHFSYQFCLSQGEETSSHYRGRVTNYLQNHPELMDTDLVLFSICGSPVMVSEVREILASHGIEKGKILFEQY